MTHPSQTNPDTPSGPRQKRHAVRKAQDCTRQPQILDPLDGRGGELRGEEQGGHEREGLGLGEAVMVFEKVG